MPVSRAHPKRLSGMGPEVHSRAGAHCEIQARRVARRNVACTENAATAECDVALPVVEEIPLHSDRRESASVDCLRLGHQKHRDDVEEVLEGAANPAMNARTGEHVADSKARLRYRIIAKLTVRVIPNRLTRPNSEFPTTDSSQRRGGWAIGQGAVSSRLKVEVLTFACNGSLGPLRHRKRATEHENSFSNEFGRGCTYHFFLEPWPAECRSSASRKPALLMFPDLRDTTSRKVAPVLYALEFSHRPLACHVARVDGGFGSSSSTCVSSSAEGQCSTPRGIMMNSPGRTTISRSTPFSRTAIRKAPLTKKNSSSSTSW